MPSRPRHVGCNTFHAAGRRANTDNRQSAIGQGTTGKGRRMTRTGRSRKLTTGTINPCIMHGLIFCFRVGGQAIFLELEGRDGCDCRVVSRSDADGAGPLSRPFLRTLGMDRRVRPTYSKTMGRTYPALTCPKCGGIQEGNFVYRNYRNRGGVFSNPATGRRLRCHRCRSAPMTGRGNAGGCSTGPVLVWKRSR